MVIDCRVLVGRANFKVGKDEIDVYGESQSVIFINFGYIGKFTQDVIEGGFITNRKFRREIFW